MQKGQTSNKVRNRAGLRQHLKNHFLPHEGNNYRPHFLRYESAAIIVAIIIVVQLAAFVQPYVISLNKNYFMAAVLPGVLVALTNEQRAENNVGTLQENSLLDEAANLKAQDMAAKGYFSHTTPEGYNSWYWLNKVGYLYSYAGENLAVNYFESEDVAKAWMASPTHRDNIVNPHYEEIGIGMAEGVYQGKSTVFVVQFFGTPKFGLVNKLAAATQNPVAEINSVVNSVVNTKPHPIKTAVIATSTSVVSTVQATLVQATSSEQILGTETSSTAMQMPLASITFLKTASASPRSNTFYLLTILAGIIFIAIIFVFFSRGKILHHDLILTGLFLIVIIAAVLTFNANAFKHTVELPADNSNSATTSLN